MARCISSCSTLWLAGAIARAQTLYLAATTSYLSDADVIEARNASTGALQWKQTISGGALLLTLTA